MYRSSSTPNSTRPRSSLRGVATLFTSVALALAACDTDDAEFDSLDDDTGYQVPGPRSASAYVGHAGLEARSDDSGVVVTAMAGDCDGPEVASDVTDSYGMYSLSLQPGATYCLKADASAWDHRFSTPLLLWQAPAGDNDIPPAHLLLGDVNGDDLFNIQDLAMIGANLDCDTAVVHEADLDEDGVVCHDDLDIATGNLGSSVNGWTQK